MLVLLPSFAIILTAGKNYILHIWVVNFVNNTYGLHLEKQQTVDIHLLSRTSEEIEEMSSPQGSGLWNSLIVFTHFGTRVDKSIFQPILSLFQWPVKCMSWSNPSWVPYNILLAFSSQLCTRDCVHSFFTMDLSIYLWNYFLPFLFYHWLMQVCMAMWFYTSTACWTC